MNGQHLGAKGFVGIQTVRACFRFTLTSGVYATSLLREHTCDRRRDPNRDSEQSEGNDLHLTDAGDGAQLLLEAVRETLTIVHGHMDSHELQSEGEGLDLRT